MGQPYIGQIRIFSFDYAPAGWAQCDGTILQTNQNTALHTLIGNTFGGSQDQFSLPDMRGRVPVGAGTQIYLGTGLKGDEYTQTIRQGEQSGTETKTLTLEDMHGHHNHSVPAFANAATAREPADSTIAKAARSVYGPPQNMVAMSPEAVGESCSGEPMSNVQRSIVFNFCIALQGTYPSHSQG